MKISIKALCLFIFFFINAQANAQFDIIGTYNKQVLQNWSGTYTRIGQYKVKGSGYFLGESFSGKIKFEGMDLMQSKNLYYDLYNQVVLIQQNNDLISVDQVIENFSVVLPEKFGGGSKQFKNTKFFGITKLKGYFEVLEEGPKAVFLKFYNIRVAPDPSNMYDKEAKLFEQYQEYYIFNPETKTLDNVKLKAKEINKAILALKLKDEDLIDLKSFDFSKELEILRFFVKINSSN